MCSRHADAGSAASSTEQRSQTAAASSSCSALLTRFGTASVTDFDAASKAASARCTSSRSWCKMGFDGHLNGTSRAASMELVPIHSMRSEASVAGGTQPALNAAIASSMVFPSRLGFDTVEMTSGALAASHVCGVGTSVEQNTSLSRSAGVSLHPRLGHSDLERSHYPRVCSAE